MVYGENLQVAVGLNHQLAIGSNLQLCINPGGLAAGVPGYPASAAITGFLGGGLGGNMQFTIGTSANFVLGRTINVNLGPPAITIGNGDGHSPTYLLCGILGSITLLWVITYATFTDDYQRAGGAAGFQLMVDALLSVIMVIEMDLAQAGIKVEELKDELWKAKLSTEQSADAEAKVLDKDWFGSLPNHRISDVAATLLTAAAVLNAAVVPLVATAVEDKW
jgi:hypothetical protein